MLDEAGAAAEHMAEDERLSRAAGFTVRGFLWKRPALSLGFRQTPPSWVERGPWRPADLDVVERPTGGGIALHGSDVSIGVVLPRAAQWPLRALMGAVCESAARLCRSHGVEPDTVLEEPSQGGRITCCLTQPSPYAVYLGERKVAGFAVRRYPQSWLVQGSLLVRPLPASLKEFLPEEVLDSLAARAVSLSEAAGTLISEGELVRRWLERWSVWWDEIIQCAEPHVV